MKSDWAIHLVLGLLKAIATGINSPYEDTPSKTGSQIHCWALLMWYFSSGSNLHAARIKLELVVSLNMDAISAHAS